MLGPSTQCPQGEAWAAKCSREDIGPFKQTSRAPFLSGRCGRPGSSPTL